jgi:hypothetical protein
MSWVIRAGADTFLNGYLEGALWSSSDQSTPQGGEPLDSNYSIRDISPESMQKAMAACNEFFDKHWTVFKDDHQAGIDFWLTRNHHGAGFMDREDQYSNNVIKELVDDAHSYGECDLIVGDDDKLHFEGGR